MVRSLVKRPLLKRGLVTQSMLQTRVQGGGAEVTTDGPGSVYVPQSTADFTTLGLEPPTYLWLCQEASGNLQSAIGSLALAAVGSGHLYEQSVANWNRKFLGTNEASNQGWYTSDAALDLAAGESFAIMAYASTGAATASTRTLIAAKGSNNCVRIRAGANVPQTIHAGAAAPFASTALYNIATVHPWVWFRNATANASGTKTDTQEVAGTHDESAIASTPSGIGTSGTVSAPARICWLAMWKGAAAEQDWKAYLQALGWTLGY